jgi:hypothetical protein
MTISSALTISSPVTHDNRLPVLFVRESAPRSYRLLTQPVRAELELRHGTLAIETERPEPAWLYPALAQLKYLTALRENWDSYGGLPPSDDVLVNATRILINLLNTDAAAPSIVPTSYGGLQLEWQTETDDVELRIWPNEQVTGFRVNRNSGDEVELEQTSISNVDPIVAFAGGAR